MELECRGCSDVTIFFIPLGPRSEELGARKRQVQPISFAEKMSRDYQGGAFWRPLSTKTYYNHPNNTPSIHGIETFAIISNNSPVRILKVTQAMAWCCVHFGTPLLLECGSTLIVVLSAGSRDATQAGNGLASGPALPV